MGMGQPAPAAPVSMEAMRAQLALTLQQQQRGGVPPQVHTLSYTPSHIHALSYRYPFIYPLLHILSYTYPLIHILSHILSHTLSYLSLLIHPHLYHFIHPLLFLLYRDPLEQSNNAHLNHQIIKPKQSNNTHLIDQQIIQGGGSGGGGRGYGGNPTGRR